MNSNITEILRTHNGKINIKEVLSIIVDNSILHNTEENFSPREFSTQEFEQILNQNLDQDSLRKIEEIREDLNALYHRKQLIYALPLLKKALDEFAEKIEFSNYKPIIITEDYRILISQFNDMEVEFSSLTQAVYILFYQNPDGINIKELSKYKNELLALYISTSKLLDFSLITNSIEELISNDNKAIYTHISRIKSTFYKIMDIKYAENYIITSDSFGSDFKYIPILKK